MSALPGAPPSLSPRPPIPLPGPGSALDSQHLPPHHRRDHPLSIFHLPNAPAPAPGGQDQSVHGGKREEGRIRLNYCKQFRGVGCVEAPPFVFHVAWRVMLALSVQFMCPCGRLAGSWGHLPVCVLFVCLCLGRSSGAPSPRDPCFVYAGAPMPALCLCALWFCLLYVCVLWCCGLCVFVALPVSVESALPVCRDLSVHPSVGAVSSAFPSGEGGFRCSPTNKLVSNCISVLRDSSEVDSGMTTHGPPGLSQSVTFCPQ